MFGKNKTVETAPVVPEVQKPREIKTVLEWTSKARPFKKRNRDYFTTIAAIVFLIGVILLFIKEFLLIGVLLAFMFVSYVLATVEPENAGHRITTEGITTGDKTYLWTEMRDFYFTQKWGEKILNINTKLRFPGRLLILLGDVSEAKIKEEVGKYVTFREIPVVTWMDKASDWLSKKVPLEKT